MKTVRGFGNEEKETEVDHEEVSDDDDGMPQKRKMVKMKGSKSGGFQKMGLSFPVLKGVLKRGYKVPTPIQRKTIPVILEGKDVVAMARTGSGKTACFLVPLFEKLKTRSAQSGARAIIFSPTRELAAQTHKFITELGKYTNLQSAMIVGGDAMENQFSLILGNPDIIVATPGRFLHICVEMELKLRNVEYVVFDEADRLFEMGFGEQLLDIVKRLPDSRQTVLFSATLPKLLVDFAKAGLTDPVLIRLDVETKIPELLKLGFIVCRAEEKSAILLYLLRQIISCEAKTVIFAATKHHVDYLHMLLNKAEISNTYIYSTLDSAARKINTAKFRTGRTKVLVVTDVAARGMDIPLLDNVINYNFPAKAKLFVHRVGRCARAGRSGTAYSLVAPDEFAYLLDVHLFLGRPLNMAALGKVETGNWDGLIGRIPPEIIESELMGVKILETSHDLESMTRVISNAYKKYLRSRPGASVESVKRAKQLNFFSVGFHPLFYSSGGELEKFMFLDKMKKFKPHTTIFEVGPTAGSTLVKVMKEKREKHQKVISAYHKKLEEKLKAQEAGKALDRRNTLPASTAEEIGSTFRYVLAPDRNFEEQIRARKKRSTIDKEHYIPYQPADHHTEHGLAVNDFLQEADRLEMDIVDDSEEGMKLQKQLKKWDRKKKKMVGVNPDPKKRKIRTESGVWIPATYKTKQYEKWLERNNAQRSDDEDSDAEEKSKPSNQFINRKNKELLKNIRPQLKHAAQILKERRKKEYLKRVSHMTKEQRIKSKQKQMHTYKMRVLKSRRK